MQGDIITNTLNPIILFFMYYPIVFFSLAGYFNGYLIRPFGLYKIIAAIFVVPYSLGFLVDVNLIFEATIPFILCVVFGFLGADKSKYYLSEIFLTLKHWVTR